MALADLLSLKRWELRHKCASIANEIDAWKAASEANQPLEKHHRQVRRIAAELQGMLAQVEAEVQALEQQASAERFFHALPRAEFFVLELHRTWDYFRQKLELRLAPPTSVLLEALDEFVWQCYLPVVRARGQDHPPEPPLVFLDGNRSPAATLRRAELILATVEERVRFTQLDGVRLRQIVVPVISLPWYDSSFLPEALLLAHEAGHLVADDLTLNPAIDDNLGRAAIDDERRQLWWRPWSSEVFADVYGTLCAGPAFVGSLATLLARKPSEMAQAADPQNRYPPPYLRMQIALAALERLGFIKQAGALRDQWQAAYGAPAEFGRADCAPDIGAVLDALLERPMAGLSPGEPQMTLRAFPRLAWDASRQQRATECAERLRDNSVALSDTDARIVLAGAALAFQFSPDFGPVDRQARTQGAVLKHILAGRAAGVRRGAARVALTQAEETAAFTEGAGLYTELVAAYERATTSPANSWPITRGGTNTLAHD